jgi:ElaB/YqjD/DUF883 family membrane-anchored ribosome-binding protein
MDSEPEVIRQQMDETRAALADKLEQLEQQVVGTVQDAADTVESVRTAVHDSVETVTHSVRHTVDAVSDSIDIPRQVQRHPWPMMLGAAAVGFAGGCWMSEPRRASNSASRERRAERASESTETSRHSTNGWLGGSSNGHSSVPTPKPPQFRESSGNDKPQPEYAASQSAHEAVSSAWVNSAKNALQPAMDQLRGLAVGALFGVVKDLLADSMPKELGVDVNGVVDQFTTSLGGKPMHGRVLPRRATQNEQRGTQPVARDEPAPSVRNRSVEAFDTPCDVEVGRTASLRDAGANY